jgi:hypothetical protein
MFDQTAMKASHQWATRPADERFLNLPEMARHFETIQDQSRELVVSTRKILARPIGDDFKALEIAGPQDCGYAPSNWAFGQLAGLAEAPANYLRKLPSPMAADCINWGLQKLRNIEDVGLLLHKNGNATLRAATGPRYGRIWNAGIVQSLIKQFGDGVSGEWKVPGEFGKDVPVTRDNTTLYAGDRDMFVFLANEKNKIEIPNRRNGKPGQLSRGFWVSNSEVGSAVFMLGTFLFDFVCMNRIVWGMQEYKEIRIRHTSAAPDRWLEEIQPALISYANSTSESVTTAVAKAQASRLAPDKVEDFLASRFGARMIAPLMMIHKVEEDRPIETLWDVTVAATAYARSMPNQDTRIEFERKAGDVMQLAA